ncbi:hypothetical protein [Escherichia coli]|uniref:hypothetical protein n=1 Tax=Escherichia coli TaxID=562 RepID=UPI00191B3028|nr:hypothetical protein [Escherichia coli]CAD6104459.1 ABC transporter protein AatB [Escherichia coli]CAD6165710.1 ABC transporter protein AatB [Escherichia coli]
MKFILAFLISFTAFYSHADTFYGTLRGGGSIDIKSPYNGVVRQYLFEEGKIYTNDSPVSIESYELNSKESILKIKIKNLKSKIVRLQRDYANSVESYKKGFVSLASLNEKDDAIKHEKINLEELSLELNALKNILKLGKPVITGKFIIRQFYISNEQLVNAGENIVRIEKIDKYLVDIKYDPVAMNGRIQDKDITFKSLVTNAKGKATVLSITNPKDNDNTQGAKIATLLLFSSSDDFHQLLDTVFEITVHDKIKH